MSEERVTLELLGARTLALTADMRDVKLRLSALENRFTVMENRLTGVENRIGVLEERINGLIALVVRIAERLDGTTIDSRIAALEERMRSLETRIEAPRG
jgi:chromosome segregation ATPase